MSDQEQLTSRRRGLKITHCSAPIRGVTLTRQKGRVKEKATAAAATTTEPLSSGGRRHYTARRACDGLVSRGGCTDSRMGRPRELQGGVHSPSHGPRHSARLATFLRAQSDRGKAAGHFDSRLRESWSTEGGGLMSEAPFRGSEGGPVRQRVTRRFSRFARLLTTGTRNSAGRVAQGRRVPSRRLADSEHVGHAGSWSPQSKGGFLTPKMPR